MSNTEKTNSIQERKNQIIQQYGEWTAHNIKLTEEIYTISNQVEHQSTIECLLQVISDNSKKRISELRILDLGCLEGLYSIELALHGATVVGIEGREFNIQKAKFAKECLQLNNIEFIQDNVLNLSIEKYGYFDVILCCGILYHLDIPDVFNFVEKMAEVCTGFTIIDTHFGEAKKTSIYKEKQYWGSDYQEFSEDTTIEQKATSLWASLHNNNSFWFTPYSLFNLLQSSGFNSIYQVFIPIPSEQDNRFVLLAHKGEQIVTKSRESKKEFLEYSF